MPYHNLPFLPFLCHVFLRVHQSPTTTQTTNRNPLPPKPSIHQKGWIINHNDPSLEYPNCINITFKMQKKDEKNDTTTHMASSDVTLCPVRAAAAIVCRIQSYSGANNNTPISAIWKYDRIDHITSKQITDALQDAVLAIGEDSLHIVTHEIGTHSICSESAMAMLHGGCPVFLIMMIGCWSGNAFLRYIRKQVEEFIHNVS